MTDRVLRVNGAGLLRDDAILLVPAENLVWESTAWDSMRSDSHQIAFKVGADAVWLQGSPARVCGSGDAVFGEGPAKALDLPACLQRMIAFVNSKLPVPLATDPALWSVSRIDVTGNLLLPSLADVRVALRVLRECEGGRYRVSQQAGDTVYWSHRSRLMSGKAYAKGPHIAYLMGKTQDGKRYSVTEIELANRLLRLELKLGAQWLRERAGKPWHELTADELTERWRDYFFRMIGETEMTDDDDLKERIIKAADTKGKGQAAYGCYLLIKNEGWEKAREAFTKPTWYRHLQVLRAAGLADADISAGNVVPLRRKVIECQMITSWHDLKKAA